MMLSLFGDAIVAVLLLATISYAAVLNRRLGVLRGDRVQLEALIRGLTSSADRAEAAIAALRAASEETGRRLEKQIEAGHSLRDDLSYMLERGVGIADRLEGTIRARRDDVKADPGERKREGKSDLSLRAEARTPVSEAGNASPGNPRSRAERELLRALGGR